MPKGGPCNEASVTRRTAIRFDVTLSLATCGCSEISPLRLECYGPDEAANGWLDYQTLTAGPSSASSGSGDAPSSAALVGSASQSGEANDAENSKNAEKHEPRRTVRRERGVDD